MKLQLICLAGFGLAVQMAKTFPIGNLFDDDRSLHSSWNGIGRRNGFDNFGDEGIFSDFHTGNDRNYMSRFHDDDDLHDSDLYEDDEFDDDIFSDGKSKKKDKPKKEVKEYVDGDGGKVRITQKKSGNYEYYEEKRRKEDD